MDGSVCTPLELMVMEEVNCDSEVRGDSRRYCVNLGGLVAHAGARQIAL